MTINPNDLRDYIECDECGVTNPRKRCSRCRGAFYCSVNCQKKHWGESHKSECVSYEIMRAKHAGVGNTLPVTTTPVNAACGICLEEPMQQQVVLKACKHAFCFACLKDWQAYSSNTGLFGAENSALSCPYCRQVMEKSVVEDAIDNTELYALRAGRLQDNDPDRKTYFELAIAEIDKVLITDERHLGALCLKGQILRHYAPADAIQVYERVLELDQEGSANYAKLEAMLNEVEVAMNAGDEDEARRLGRLVQAYQASGAFTDQIGSGPQRLFDLMVALAEAHEAVGNWQEALKIYMETLRKTDASSGGLQNRMLIAGTAGCFHRLSQYDRAVQMGQMALAMNRQYPGVHKLVAMPQLALGQVEAARTTMRRGILYEAPWNDKNRQENIAFLEECLRDETTTMEGV